MRIEHRTITVHRNVNLIWGEPVHSFRKISLIVPGRKNTSGITANGEVNIFKNAPSGSSIGICV